MASNEIDVWDQMAQGVNPAFVERQEFYYPPQGYWKTLNQVRQRSETATWRKKPIVVWQH